MGCVVDVDGFVSGGGREPGGRGGGGTGGDGDVEGMGDCGDVFEESFA